MSPRRRQIVAIGIVLATTVLVRGVVPDAASRRGWSLLVLLSLGYGHQLGALVAGFRRGGARRQMWTFVAIAAGFGGLLAWLPPAPLAALLTAIALWHVFENEGAMRRVDARSGSSRLPALARAGAAWRPALAALAATFGVVVAPPEITRGAIALGLPPALAVWTWEDLIALGLFHHVVSWALFATRAGSRRLVVVSHGLPLAAASVAVGLWPGSLDWLASPLPYLLTSVAHAIHTAVQRGVEHA